MSSTEVSLLFCHANGNELSLSLTHTLTHLSLSLSHTHIHTSRYLSLSLSLSRALSAGNLSPLLAACVGAVQAKVDGQTWGQYSTMVETLIAAGISKDASGIDGNTALHIALEGGVTDIAAQVNELFELLSASSTASSTASTSLSLASSVSSFFIST